MPRANEDAWTAEPVPYYSWMWADSDVRPAPLDIGHGGAEPEATRWSAWLGRDAALQDLQLYRTQDNLERPVEVRIAAALGHHGKLLPGSKRFLSRFKSLDAVIDYLSRGGAVLAVEPEGGAAEAAAVPAAAPAAVAAPAPETTTRTELGVQAPPAPAPSGADELALENGGADGGSASGKELGAAGAADAVWAEPEALASSSPVPSALPQLREAPSTPPAAAPPSAQPSSEFRRQGETAGAHAISIGSAIGYVGYLGLPPSGFLPCFGVLAWLALRPLQGSGSRHFGFGAAEDEEESSEDDDGVELGEGAGGPNLWQAFMGAPREGEMRRLLFYAEQQPQALPPLPADDAAPVGPAQRPEAEAAVQRILATGRPRELFAARDAAGRSDEFRHLVQLLHPDSGLVPRERAMPALTRVVEAYRSVATD